MRLARPNGIGIAGVVSTDKRELHPGLGRPGRSRVTGTTR
jgi:hypothetical protein